MNLKNYMLFILLFFTFIHISQCMSSPNVEVIPISLQRFAELKGLQVEKFQKYKQHNFYHLHFNEFPKIKKINLTIKRPSILKNNKALETMQNFILLENGHVLESNKSESEEFAFVSEGFLPGEKIFLEFQTDDKQFHYEMSMTPFPLISESKNHKFSIEAELVTAMLGSYWVKIKGLKDNQLYVFTSKSGNEEMKQILNYSDFKEMSYGPAVIGKSEGIGELTICSLEDKDTATLKLPWGNYLEKILQGKTSYQNIIKSKN